MIHVSFMKHSFLGTRREIPFDVWRWLVTRPTIMSIMRVEYWFSFECRGACNIRARMLPDRTAHASLTLECGFHGPKLRRIFPHPGNSGIHRTITNARPLFWYQLRDALFWNINYIARFRNCFPGSQSKIDNVFNLCFYARSSIMMIVLHTTGLLTFTANINIRRVAAFFVHQLFKC